MNEAAVGENYVRRTLSSGTTYLPPYCTQVGIWKMKRGK